MNSHIQVPQLLLRKFQHKETEIYQNYINHIDCVYFLDIENLIINTEKVRLIGTEINYYGDGGEKILDDNVETPFGDSINKILDGDYKSLNFNDYNSIKRFAYYCVLRSKNVLTALINNEYLKLKGKNTPEIVVETVSDRNNYSDTMIEIIENKTSIDFVIPNNCLIFTSEYDILPISPRTALVLRKKKLGEVESHAFSNKTICDEAYVKAINRASFEVEKRNRGIVIAKKRESLVELSKDLGIEIHDKEGDA